MKKKSTEICFVSNRKLIRNLVAAITTLLSICILLRGEIVLGKTHPKGGSKILWQIGAIDHSKAEFALAPNDYQRFLEYFGKPDHAYYIGISKPKIDWPYIMPGPLNGWAGSRRNGTWDQMNTLPIGFVIEQKPSSGKCLFTINILSTDTSNAPTLRILINGKIFERKLIMGEQVVKIEFPAALLKSGYNEISLRNTTGSWFQFDAINLETPSDTRLSKLHDTVIRSLSSVPYAVSSDEEQSATVRVELYHKGPPCKIKVEIGKEKIRSYNIEPGLQVIEVPAPPSKKGEPTNIKISSEKNILCDTQLTLNASPVVTPSDYVDVILGTAHSRWMIAPGPWMPFSMVKISPDNQPQNWCSGYEYSHEYIDCFSHIHEWTMAGLGMMPTVGKLRTQPGLDDNGYSSRFDKFTEKSGIGFYEVFLKDSGIKVDLTATTRASLQKYTFPATDQARVIFNLLLPNEYLMHVLSAEIKRSGPAEIEGTIKTDFPGVGYNGDQRFDLHFVSQFSRPFEEMGGWEYLDGADVTIQKGYKMPKEVMANKQAPKIFSNVHELKISGYCGAFVNFKTSDKEEILVRTGISLVSTKNARENLEQEMSQPFGWNFNAVVQNQRKVWNKIFNRVEIETQDAREKTRFYSNLYRALSGRNTWSDVNGEWVDPDERVQKLKDPNAVMLGCDALWTTFWNLNQVMNLITPEWSRRWVNSELALYDKCGWLSKGPAGLEYISVMVAEHEIPLLIAAYQHGLKGLDANKILEASIKMQTTMPEHYPGGGAVGNANLENYLKYNYVAEDGPIGPGGNAEWRRAWTSNTYEYAYDDWCVGRLALSMGRKETAEKFLKRSENWRNVFDVKTGFARPRKIDGSWVKPFDPYHTPGFVEGNAWQYTWFVPQDVPGLIKAMGKSRFVNGLNEAFEQSAATRFASTGGRAVNVHNTINHGNQPTMQVSWLFNWAGKPWLTQKWVHGIMEAYYGFNPADAYLGDEDQGQMSAWFVMSSLGLFEMDGGCTKNPVYEIGSPLYPKVVIHSSEKEYGGKRFIIEAHNASPTNEYIQSATLNGKPLKQWWIRWNDIVNGGHLIFELGPKQNENWAKDCSLPK